MPLSFVDAIHISLISAKGSISSIVPRGKKIVGKRMRDESVLLPPVASPTTANCERSCSGIVINRHAPRKREREVPPDLTPACGSVRSPEKAIEKEFSR